MSMWVPQLTASPGSAVYRLLAKAIAGAIEDGTLGPGARLPPQRDLAQALGISVGAVTRAYDAAARRGLITGQVGRGSFVVDRGGDVAARESILDISINLPPPAAADLSADVVASLRQMGPLMERLAYAPPAGFDADRRAGARWLQRVAGFGTLDWRRLICCGGTQSGMAIALAAAGGPGATVLCEAATFSGALSLAAQQGYRLHPVTMDEEGVRPDALDRAAAETGARLVYTLPTLHNPTTRTMSRRRRDDIVAIAEARDLILVEDDVYGAYARDLDLPPLAALAPDRTIYLSSLSKVFAPGLRAGYLVAPPGPLFERCLRASRALTHSPPGIGFAIATEWIASGRADDLVLAACTEIRARTSMALAALGDAVASPPTAASLHLWLPMTAEAAERTAGRALAAGLRLTPPRSFLVSGEDSSVSGLRLCLGAAPNRATLERALSILDAALSGAAGASALDPL